MDNNTRDVIVLGGAALLIGLACLATQSADPLWLLLVFWFFFV